MNLENLMEDYDYMNYPQFLKKGDVIGICAPSGGIVGEEKITKLELAEEQLENMGYKILETESVRKEERGRSASGEQRAKEFMELLENQNVKSIIFATGGDFLIEMLDFLDFEKIRFLEPKWMQGFSDITGISFLFNTILDIPTIYCQTIKDYAMVPLYRNLKDALRLQEGEEVVQKSFEKCEKVVDFRIEDNKQKTNDIFENNSEILQKDTVDIEELKKGYDLTEKVIWKNIFGQGRIEMKGRSIGGCLDCIKSFIGTKYDRVNEYIEKHKNDGIIWFLEVFEMNTPELYRTLWQMKNAGYFKYCNGIIFGRSLFIRNDYDINFNDTVKEVLKDLDIPVICDADIGHVAPQMAIVNGAILEIISEKGKGIVKTYFD